MDTFYIYAFWIYYCLTVFAITYDIYQDRNNLGQGFFDGTFKENIVDIIAIVIIFIPIVNLIAFIGYFISTKNHLMEID